LWWETADPSGKSIAGSGDRESRDLKGETADQSGKWIVGSGDRKSRDLGWETADHRGLRVQSPIRAMWGGLFVKKKLIKEVAMLGNKRFFIP